MTLQVAPLTEEYCKQICLWRYPAPYHVYNWPSWDMVVAQDMQFADPELRKTQFAAVVQLKPAGQKKPMEQKEANYELVGYVQFFPLQGVTRLGVGMRPDLCSQGLSGNYMQIIISEAIRRNPDKEIDLEVHTWNRRAQKAYLKAGFKKTDEYVRLTDAGRERFYCMVYRKNN
jgi:ribosomal-protein-alanine N-acetyltransferase